MRQVIPAFARGREQWTISMYSSSLLQSANKETPASQEETPASQEETPASQEAIPAKRENSDGGTEDAHCAS